MPAQVTLVAPPGFNSTVDGGGGRKFLPNADGSVTVDGNLVAALLSAGFKHFRVNSDTAFFIAPAAADLVSIVAAVTPANGALTIAAQPDFPRKLQVRLVDDGTHHITAGTLTLVGIDGRGNAITEVISIITAVSVTLKTANAYAHLTSATVAGMLGGQSTDTIGIGVAADLALPIPGNTFADFSVYKENVSATAAAVMADEAVGTVDTVAGTVSPTTAPNGAHSFMFWYAFAPTG